ncbi:hypothetical protein BDR06DRAFT_968782 [Suillus hirtellus]|nr:hypothetical protein BDR06DRAFT_968782 [Suillus hirtellus]
MAFKRRFPSSSVTEDTSPPSLGIGFVHHCCKPSIKDVRHGLGSRSPRTRYVRCAPAIINTPNTATRLSNSSFCACYDSVAPGQPQLQLQPPSRIIQNRIKVLAARTPASKVFEKMDRRTMLKLSKSKARVGSCVVWDLVTCPIYRHFLVERKFHADSNI